MTSTIRLTREYCSNFMSYGNNVNEFIFEKDGTITWIKGPNGVGKSVIIEMLSFAWFGRPYRKIKKNIGLRNTSNVNSKAPTIVGVEFEKIDGDTVVKYETIRRMTKSGTLSLTILKDGNELDKAVGMTQKKLEDEILGFDYTIFENIISLNTIQTVPIIDMPPEKKRKLLESIATIHLDKFKKLNKETLKDMQIKFISATNDIEQYTKDATELSLILAKLEEEKKAGIEDLEKQVKTLVEQIGDYEKNKKELEAERDKLRERGINKKTELDKYNGVANKINNYKAILTHLEYLIPIPDKLKKQQEKYDVTLKEFKTYTNRLNELGYDNEKHKAISDELNKVNKIAIDFLMRTKELKNQIDKIVEDGKALKAGKPCITCGKPSTEEDVEKIKKNYREKYNVLNNEYKEALKKQEANQLRVDEMSAEKEKLDKDKEKHAEITAKLNAASSACDRETTEIDNLQGEKERKESQIKKLFGENGDSEILSVDEVTKNITALEVQLEIRAGLETDLNDIRIEATQKIEKIKALRDNIDNVTVQIDAIGKKISDKKAMDIDDARSRTAKKLEDTKGDLDRAYGRVSKYSDEVSKCKYIDGMYADDGIKQIILQAFVPNLNKAIAHNLLLFELPFSVEFNDSMEYEFTGKLGLAQEYGGLSQGQTRKLNFAITIAFRDFVAAIADFKINILFLDEVLDISTDDEALEHMLQLLKAKVSEVGQIYLMTHRGQNYLEYFDHIVEIEHDGRYGTIKKIK